MEEDEKQDGWDTKGLEKKGDVRVSVKRRRRGGGKLIREKTEWVKEFVKREEEEKV